MPGGKFTDHVPSAAMKEKDILRMEGPFGSFFLREDSDKPLVLLASGTGFAPIKALMEHMQFKAITRPATLYWGGRRKADLYMHDWVPGAGRGRDAATCAMCRWCPNLPCPKTAGRAAPASCTKRGAGPTSPDLSAPPGLCLRRAGRWWKLGQTRFRGRVAGLPDEEFYADSFTSEADKSPQARFRSRTPMKTRPSAA